MSEESNVNGLPSEKDENLKSEGRKEDNDPKPPTTLDESPFNENAEISAEQMRVQENRQLMEPAESETQNGPVFRCLEGDLEVTQSSPSKKQLSTSDASTETKHLERISDVSDPSAKSTTFDASTEIKSLERMNDSEPIVKPSTSDASTEIESLERMNDISEPIVKPSTSDTSTETNSLDWKRDISELAAKSAGFDVSSEKESPEWVSDADQLPAKSTASSEISPSRVPSSDKGLEKVAEDIQIIYEGLKVMKISAEEIPVSASAKKGRKPPTTPRARSTPVKPLTSPPLTRSRSRDLRKFPSTPSSPRSSASKKTSESGSDEARGRQRAKKN